MDAPEVAVVAGVGEGAAVDVGAGLLAAEPDVSELAGVDASEALSGVACGAAPVAGF